MEDFLNLWLAIVGTYIVQMLIKVTECIIRGTFDWRELLKGWGVNFIYFIAIGVMFYVGTLLPDTKIITINTVGMSLSDAVMVIGWLLEAKQVYDVFCNFKSYFCLDKLEIAEYPQDNDVRG